MHRHRLMCVLLAVALVASPLTAAGSLAARACGIILPHLVELGLQILSLSVALVAAAIVTLRLLPASRSGCREEAVAILAATCWALLQWLLSAPLSPLAS